MTVQSVYHHTTEQIQEELRLIEAAKINPERFAPLYNKYYKQIFNYVYQRMDSKDTAFDTTSTVFLKAMTNLRSYRFQGLPFSSWLYRIAHNEVMQVFRTEKGKRTVNADVGDLRHLCEEQESNFMEEYIPALKKLIGALPEDELQLVEMRYFEKRQFKEIADILNITETNAKVRMHRILEKLKKHFAKIKSE
jgi:RNA polymerase sigma-70 factor, ECF subfamily